MTYCLNPYCQTPQNPVDAERCGNCGRILRLRDRYRALEKIGQGSYGQTFLGIDEMQPSDRCIIKQFLPTTHLPNNAEVMAKATQQFEQAAFQLLELAQQHRQIPKIFAYFEQDNAFHIIQEFIVGQNLWQEVQEQGAMSEHQLRLFLKNLLPVLQFIHEHQIVHQDIKPTNILRRSAGNLGLNNARLGELLLIDFKLSQHLSSSGIPISARPFANQGYTPIEQIRSSKAYPASDLYSLGVTCIYLLTATDLNDLFDPLNGQWRWREHLRQNNKDVSDELAQILDRMLKEWMNERYQWATEILSDLEQINVENPNVTLSLGETERSPRVVPALRVPIMATPPPKAISRPTTAETLPSNTPKMWRCIQVLKGHSRFVNAVAISPDGQLISSGSGDKTIKFWHFEQKNPVIILTAHADDVTSVAFSPNGKLIASSSLDRTIKLWLLPTGKADEMPSLQNTLIGHTESVLSVAFSPCAPILASGSWDNTIKLWQLPTGKLLHTLKGHLGGIRSIAFSPDGQILASGSWDKTIKLWELPSGKLLDSLFDHQDSVSSVAFHGRSLSNQQGILAYMIASGSDDKTIKLWQYRREKHHPESELIRTLSGHSKWVNAIAFHPGLPMIASGSRDKTIKLWHLPTGRLLHTLSRDSDSVSAVTFSPDGLTLISGSEDKTIRLWQES